ncbi:hypothetical protein LTR84_003770 [Exophiala bonariae]|uniref:Uncharacterized protein n=1 Tax=Exophiala bonariae TaxID=1690606 RepID=A0AAV9N6Y5_9EURO|nr:hypothetical protein LTR84_003770 [Exophiala bonariae]
MAICIATIVATFTARCTFSIEIEISYWMYWGGYFCVFGSAPDAITVTRASRWVKLNWTATVLFIQHMVMLYHGIWFVWCGYDQVFARMPCGTYQFLLAPMLDPSQPYKHVRDVLMILAMPTYRLRCAVFGIIAYGLSIAAIELTLKWNKVVNVNYLAATGQYISLTVGAGSLISVIWSIIRQETERRRQARTQQILQQQHDEEGIELQSTSNGFSTALRHAFEQRDAEFFRSGGLLPATEPEAAQYTDSISRNGQFLMSGGLAAMDELHALPWTDLRRSALSQPHE